jgi:hypothetical protein
MEGISSHGCILAKVEVDTHPAWLAWSGLALNFGVAPYRSAQVQRLCCLRDDGVQSHANPCSGEPWAGGVWERGKPVLRLWSCPHAGYGAQWVLGSYIAASTTIPGFPLVTLPPHHQFLSRRGYGSPLPALQVPVPADCTSEPHVCPAERDQQSWTRTGMSVAV